MYDCKAWPCSSPCVHSERVDEAPILLDSDGELLIVSQLGSIRVFTELGMLDVGNKIGALEKPVAGSSSRCGLQQPALVFAGFVSFPRTRAVKTPSIARPAQARRVA
jgi:homogentisate 1,2-dioxygenase